MYDGTWGGKSVAVVYLFPANLALTWFLILKQHELRILKVRGLKLLAVPLIKFSMT
jgi:hypothetical protein